MHREAAPTLYRMRWFIRRTHDREAAMARLSFSEAQLAVKRRLGPDLNKSSVAVETLLWI